MIKYIVSPSPHVGDKMTTQKIMLFVIIALLPATIFGVINFGLYALLTIILSVSSAVFAEYIYCRVSKQAISIGDLSAVVTGLILGLSLPPVVPFYLPIAGSTFAIIVIKMLFGGLGKNFANPAGSARVFLLLAWAGNMTSYAKTVNYSDGVGEALFGYFKGIFGNIDGMTSATPLAFIKNGDLTNIDISKLFFGNIGGSIGEVSAIAILIGGIFLIVTKIIDWKVPVCLLGTVAICAVVFYPKGFNYILPSILSGGIMLGTFFMATDYASSPNSVKGNMIFAVGIGVLTMLIRRFGNYPEGFSLALLFMNLFVPLIDKYIIQKPFGYRRKKFTKKGKISD